MIHTGCGLLKGAVQVTSPWQVVNLRPRLELDGPRVRSSFLGRGLDSDVKNGGGTG